MGRLQDLYREQGQSPWLDNIKRGWITLGEPRVHAAEVVEFFLGPAPARPQQPEK